MSSCGLQPWPGSGDSPRCSRALPSVWQPCTASTLRPLLRETCVYFSDEKTWNLGLSNAKLSYYDGMIQLNYRGGTPYNNERHTPRATLITFLCDRDAGVGFPEYQVGMFVLIALPEDTRACDGPFIERQSLCQSGFLAKSSP